MKTTDKRATRPAPPAPAGDVRIVWTVDPRRWDDSGAYQAGVEELLRAHFPGRAATPADLLVAEDEDGTRVVVALCGIDAFGDFYTDPAGRRTRQRVEARLRDGWVLPA